MPEIGATLREARMRARIDISEIEAETKIRAKYLRALENEEWGLLPGPAYVRSFLRTYAEALGLDAKLLLEEYKLRHERPSDHDLMPIGAPRRGGGSGRGGRGGRGGGRGGPRQPRGIPVGLIVGVIIVLLVGALYGLGKLNRSDDNGDSGTSGATVGQTTTTAVPRTRTSRRRSSSTSRRTRTTRNGVAVSSLATVAITATSGQVFACLVDAGGNRRINGATLNQGVTTPVYRSRSFRLRLGNGNARLRVNGRNHDVPDASPIAFTITKGTVKRVDVRKVPDCS
ncbi:helix-turn-helix domain-containing protein [Conexibacter woesei]|uniref:helix-turn-helix domain-containing protein n=1 Tax=Conexibacter woesei TaxID=191495 RepID=UPI0009DB72F3|nr:helix-turn-helix domain-containing protein [Conexibacter woesei]